MLDFWDDDLYWYPDVIQILHKTLLLYSKHYMVSGLQSFLYVCLYTYCKACRPLFTQEQDASLLSYHLGHLLVRLPYIQCSQTHHPPGHFLMKICLQQPLLEIALDIYFLSLCNTFCIGTPASCNLIGGLSRSVATFLSLLICTVVKLVSLVSSFRWSLLSFL